MLTKGLSVDKDNLSKVLYNYLKDIQIDYTTVKGVLIGAKNIDDMVKQYMYLIGNLDMTDVKVGGYILHSLNTLGVKHRLKRSMVYKGYKVPTPIYIIKVLGINIHTNDTSLVVNLYKNECNNDDVYIVTAEDIVKLIESGVFKL